MLVLGLANFYIASIRETLRAVNVMTTRHLARIQRMGPGGPRFVYTLKNICAIKYKKIQKIR